MSIPKACGDQGWSLGGGCGRGGAKSTAQKKILQTSAQSRRKKKPIISQKLRITQKKSFMQKFSTRSIPIYSANFATFEESWFFGALLIFWAPIIYLVHCASFMSRWPLLNVGGGVWISLVEKQPKLVFITISRYSISGFQLDFRTYSINWTSVFIRRFHVISEVTSDHRRQEINFL